MTLESHPVDANGLNAIQSAAWARAERRAMEMGGLFPQPESAYIDTAGGLHCFWHVRQAKMFLDLSRKGDIETRMTMDRADAATVRECVAFQMTVQALFAVDEPIGGNISKTLAP